jgi:hypothetical protein
MLRVFQPRVGCVFIAAGVAFANAWAGALEAQSTDEFNWIPYVLTSVVVIAFFAGFWFRRYKAKQHSSGYAKQAMTVTWNKSDSSVLPQYNPKNVGNDASARPWEGPSFELRSTTPEGSSPEASDYSRFDSHLVKPLQVKMPNFHPHASGFEVQKPSDGNELRQKTFANTPWVRAHGAPNIDRAQFLAMAKSHFLSLQEAWDHHDLSRVHEFLSEEMFAQVQLQVQGLANEPSSATTPSEVMWLEAQWMGLDTSADDLLANVELSGMVREGLNASPTPFREIWTWKLLSAPDQSSQNTGLGRWVVCGLEALQS